MNPPRTLQLFLPFSSAAHLQSGTDSAVETDQAHHQGAGGSSPDDQNDQGDLHLSKKVVYIDRLVVGRGDDCYQQAEKKCENNQK